MKTKITLFFLLMSIQSLLNAQSISINHLFPGEVVPYLSKGNVKTGWVSKNGNYYASNIMDSMQNIQTITDTNLTLVTGGFPANEGVTLCGSTMNSSDNLIGMFYDWDCWLDTSMLTGIYFGNGCYFLYDFNTQQRSYFYFNTPTFVQPEISTLDCDYHFNWINDTLVVTLQYTDLTFSNFNHGYCLKFVNNQLIEQGEILVASYVVDVFIDQANKVNQLYDQVTGGNWTQNDGVNYNFDLTPSNTTYYSDAEINGNNLYILQNHFSAPGEQDSIVSYNNGSPVNAMVSPMTGVYSSKVLCHDHAGRTWVAKGDSVYMFNGTNWSAFDFGGINLQTQLISPTYIKSFFEYNNNCFALSFSEDLLDAGGNGMLLFCYSDSSTVTNSKNKNLTQNSLFFPNPASNVISSNSLIPNQKLTIKNVLGESIISQTVFHSSLSIDISAFPAGIYFIELINDNQEKSIQKLIITREQ